jgi:hypothetical protein
MMPGFCKPEPQSLVVVFERDGEEPVRIEAADGEKALIQALKLLLTRNVLRPGDRLTVKALTDD